jgi:hypothetical protein
VACRAEALEPRTLLAADFVGTAFNVAPDLIPGQRPGIVPTISITFTVTNKNGVPVIDDAFKTYVVRIYLSSNNIITATDDLIAGIPLAGLGAGKSETKTITVEVNSGNSNLPKIPGSDPFLNDNQYYIGMIVDADDAIDESNEGNNANQGLQDDMDDIYSEIDLPIPLNGTQVQSREYAIGSSVAGVIGDEWAGRRDIDLYNFLAIAGQTVMFDIDNGGGIPLDSTDVRVYDINFNLLATTISNRAPGEPLSEVVGYAVHTFATTGAHYVAVGNGTGDPRNLSSRSDGTGDTGSFVLTSRVIPDAPGQPNLLPQSDTGVSNTDNLTRDITPSFQLVGPAGGVAKLYFGSSVVAQDSTSTANGLYILTASTLQEGNITVRATVTVDGVESDFGDSLQFRIDTIPPPTPIDDPNMDQASDTGFDSFDAITSDATPSFHGTTTAGGTLTLLIDGAAVATMVADGSYEFTVPAPLANGPHVLVARLTDDAGNVSGDSPPENFVIDTVAPAAPPRIDLTTDTGSSATDNLTNDVRPFVAGTAEAGTRLTVRSNGTIKSALVTVPSTGAWSVQMLTLANGLNSLTAVAEDAAGNVSPPSPGLPVTVDTVPPPSPTRPDMRASSDSGASDADDVTSDPTPTLDGTATPDIVVQIRDGASLVGIGFASATDGTYAITPFAALPQGTRLLRAVATDAAGNDSPLSHFLSVTIDSVGPNLAVPPQFLFNTVPQRLVYTFNENVGGTLTRDDLTLQRDRRFTTDPLPPPVPTGSTLLVYEPASRVATLTFPGLTGGVLPDGNYAATLAAAGVTDLAGNPFTGTPTFNFFVFAADANHDRQVNFTDLVTLAQNYNQSGKTFPQGDFNYDGSVDFADLVMLAQRYNTLLPQNPIPQPAAVAAVAPVPTLAPTADDEEQSHERKAATVFSTTPLRRPVAPPRRPVARR